MKTQDLKLHYYYIRYRNQFIIKQRDDSFIWKKLYDFPKKIPLDFEKWITHEKTIHHKLTHKNLEIVISEVSLNNKKDFLNDSKNRFYCLYHFRTAYSTSLKQALIVVKKHK